MLVADRLSEISLLRIEMTPQSASKPGSPHVCRLCLSNNGQLHRIYGGGIKDLAEQIYDITALELEDINGIPSLICELCRSQVLVSHQFVLQCRISNWKYQNQLLRAQPTLKNNKSLRLSTDSSSSGFGELVAENSGTSAQVPAAKTGVAIPLKHEALRRLKNDDSASRRHSIDQIRKAKAKKPPKRRLSDSSQHDKAMIKVKRDVKNQKDKDPRKQQCPTCGNRVIHLKGHILNMHRDVPKHVCPVCGKEFKHKQWFTCHVNEHNGIRPYKCELCDKGYSYQKSLNEHVKSHQERYYCIVCNGGFTHVKLMREHMLIHGARKP